VLSKAAEPHQPQVSDTDPATQAASFTVSQMLEREESTIDD
jgi:hypothetical protein